MNAKYGIRLIAIVSILGVLLAASTLPTLAQAAAPTLPPRPAPALPSRPNPSPTPTPTPAPAPSFPLGAFIELRVSPPQIGLWTVVQWQDRLGDWHAVEGWQGTLEDGGVKQWWVAPEDFGTGPFRWLVLDQPEGEPLATSEAFDLPDAAGEKIVVAVQIEP